MVDLPSPLTSRGRSFAADNSGVAAVEMAFIAPVALALLALGVAGGQSMALNHKVVLAAHSVTDLVSRTVYSPDSNLPQSELLLKSDLDTDLALASMVMYPNATAGLSVVMSELKVDANNNTGVVVWSEPSFSGVKLATGTRINLDPAYIATGATYLLYGQVTYTFQPIGGILNLPPITLSSTETLTIRNAQQIDIPGL